MARTLLLLDGLLTLDECEGLIRKAETRGFSRARLHQAGRRNHECFIEWPALGETIKLRLPDSWAVSEVDDLFEVYRYQRGDEIQIHTDSGRRIRSGISSNATLLIYLSANFRGGCTVFTDTDNAIAPAIGKAVVFSHGLPHRADPVSSGTKYVARLDIILRET